MQRVRIKRMRMPKVRVKRASIGNEMNATMLCEFFAHHMPL